MASLQVVAATSGLQLGRAEAIQVYACMALSRALDDLEIVLKQQNLAYFQISGAGHEASGAVAALYLQPGKDWFFPYYRDRALCLGLGLTPFSMLLQTLGAPSCGQSGGRQMPSHWSAPSLHIVSESSPTGVQFLTAVGAAAAGRYLHTAEPEANWQDKLRFAADEVVYCSAGEGATSEGWFYEAISAACLERLPVVFHIEDNDFAISTPVAQQTPGGSISQWCGGFAKLHVIEFDGCCINASAAAWQQAVAHARARRGPVLLHAHVVRLYSHSLSDDERQYRSPSDIARSVQRDPLQRAKQLLLGAYGIEAEALEQLDRRMQHAVATAKHMALAHLQIPCEQDIYRYVFSPQHPPESPRFSGGKSVAATSTPSTMLEAINTTLNMEMAHNPAVVVFGQDVADVGDERLLQVVKGKGGVFKATLGLQRRYGVRRVFNTPLSESLIVGKAIGMALRGLKPVIEIQFFDYIFAAMMHIRSELALMRWRSYNGWAAPMVIRCPYGGYLRGGAVFHSQTGETLFASQPGLKVVMPSTSEDAAGLLRTAIRCDDPVLFLEHKHLYRQTYNRAVYPGEHFMIPFGCAKLCRQGKDLTMVTYGALVKKSLDAADLLATEHGIDCEVLDLRSLLPYDFAAIVQSVRKTNRLLVVHEEAKQFGFGAEIAARVQEELFYELEAPVARVGSSSTFVAYHPQLEAQILPQIGDIVSKSLALMQGAPFD